MAKGISRGGQRGRGTINIGIDIDPPLMKIAEQYGRLKTQILDLRPAWHRLLPLLRRQMAAHFQSEGAATGQAWAPLSKKTIGDKRKNNSAMLILSGRLFNKLTQAGKIALSRKVLRFGVKHPAARALNFGMKTKGGKVIMPKRRLVYATATIKQLAYREINKQLDENLKTFAIKR